MESVLAPHAGSSEFSHQGQRVVVRQRIMQAASDMFLGWIRYRDHDYYVWQFRDMKGSVNIDVMTPAGFSSYAQQVRRDYDALVAAAQSGRVTAMDAQEPLPGRTVGRRGARPHGARRSSRTEDARTAP
jgi:uncharacterized protein DUF2252